MADSDREIVRELDQARKAMRSSLLLDVQQARHDLQPRVIAARWAERQLNRAARGKANAVQTITNNAPAIGAGIAAVLLFAARKPIWKWFQRLGNRRLPSKEDVQ